MQANEVERMRRQLADQQRRERQLVHLQDSRHQLLKETATKLKWQATAVRGGYEYREYNRTRLAGGGKLGSKMEPGVKYSSPYKLPSLGTTKKKHEKKKKRFFKPQYLSIA